MVNTLKELQVTEQNYFVHPTAVIDEGCEIGKGTRVWHFCHLTTGCTIGQNCNIGQNVFIAANVILGNNVKVQNNVSLYDGVTCGDDVFIGPSAVFTNVINPRSAISRKNEFKKTIIKKGASIGANATIICGTGIGEYALIGAGAVVTKDVSPYELVTGNPARHAGWMSERGCKLEFDIAGNAICQESQQHYRLENNQVYKS